MVNEQLKARGIRSTKVLNAFLTVPRHLFVSKTYLDYAYDDYPLPIGQAQTISQPFMVALMTEQLDIKETDKVLEIGTGSGYQTAILAELSKRVHSLEVRSELSFKAKAILDALGYQNIDFHIGNGYDGLKSEAPFDKIIVTAAPKDIPEGLLRDLKVGGLMITPTGDLPFQTLYLVHKTEHAITKDVITYCRFVEMI